MCLLLILSVYCSIWGVFGDFHTNIQQEVKGVADRICLSLTHTKVQLFDSFDLTREKLSFVSF